MTDSSETAPEKQALEAVILEMMDDVAVLRLNRPERMNALNADMRASLNAHLDTLAGRRGLRGIILTGEGRGFCSGQDLSERKPLPDGQKYDLGEALQTGLHPLVQRLSDLDVPLLCLVNGTAAGAGVGLALCADLVIAVPSARFILSFARIWLVPDAGLSVTLAARVGLSRALGAAMTAKSLDAQTAQDWGLVWDIAEDPQAEIARLADWLNTAPTAALVATRRAMQRGTELAAQLSYEAQVQRAMGFADDYTEGVTAFREKRSPIFAGC